jgi:hypothetical protein
MKILILISFVLALSLISCVKKENKEPDIYIEKQISFFDLRHSDWTKNQWIRKPKNLKIIHETFKKYGYDKLKSLISMNESEFLIEGVYIKQNFEVLMDSLELTYKKPETKSEYYAKFWNRRKAEYNDSIVYEIIRELNTVRKNKKALIYEDRFVNDTLFDLLKIEFDRNGSLSPIVIERNFNTLKKYQLHQSAYTLLFERPENYKALLERDKLKKGLIKAKKYTHPWLMDTQK